MRLFVLVCVILLVALCCALMREQKPLPKSLIESQEWALDTADDCLFVGISLPSRQVSHFQPLAAKLMKSNARLQLFPALKGSDLVLESYKLAPRYSEFFARNQREHAADPAKPNYRGHFGCTISHLTVIGAFARQARENQSLLVLEDDADPTPKWRKKLDDALTNLREIDPEWQVLVLGCSANYKDHPSHKLNDVEPVYWPGLVRMHYWIGGWAYLIRSRAVADHIMAFFDPISWHIDIVLAEKTRSGELRTWACIPPIILHPGRLRISAWDQEQIGDVRLIRSDTNT